MHGTRVRNLEILGKRKWGKSKLRWNGKKNPKKKKGNPKYEGVEKQNKRKKC